MHTENVYLVILLVIAIVVFSNLAMYALVRSSRGLGLNWLRRLRQGSQHPFSQEDQALEELRQQVRNLQQRGEEENEKLTPP